MSNLTVDFFAGRVHLADDNNKNFRKYSAINSKNPKVSGPAPSSVKFEPECLASFVEVQEG